MPTQSQPSAAIAEASGGGGIIAPAFTAAEETFHFCMCNPPFFESIEEASSNPKTACGGKHACLLVAS